MKGNELKPHIGIFGRRNYGKSSLINYLTGQSIAIVSILPGTTTDPVKKSMEIGGIGPVVLIDTAGIDDTGSVGQQRVDSSLAVLPQCDLALILFTANRFDDYERSLVESCRNHKIPFLPVYSQADTTPPDPALLDSLRQEYGTEPFVLSVTDQSLLEPLRQRLRSLLPSTAYNHPSLLGDVVSEGDTVVMVTPIDSSAPEGRMILPQVQVLRDLLDNHARAVVCRETEFASTLSSLAETPSLVVTDSQVFALVRDILDSYQSSHPDRKVYLTSFSVVLARAKGLFDDYLRGTPAIDRLRDGDRVLMLESCTHNVTCEDIGRVKLPKLLARYTDKQLHCDIAAGLSPIDRPLSDYSLVIQCGGCVITRQQLAARLQPALDAGVPVSNYGLAIAYMNGIFHRSTEIFNQKSVI